MALAEMLEDEKKNEPISGSGFPNQINPYND